MVPKILSLLVAGVLCCLSACSSKVAQVSNKQMPAPLVYLDTSLSTDERVEDLIGRMTLAEKLGQMVHDTPAIEHLGINQYNWWNEALHGVARAGLATSYPQAIGMAAMWDETQMLAVASAISD